MLRRLVIVSSVLAMSSQALAQAPVVRAGECVYLYGAPPGEPAAATEEFRSGTKVYDVCTHTTNADVGRDAPHRLAVWTEWLGSGLVEKGCVTTAWTEHEFILEGEGPTRILVSVAGDATALLFGRSPSDHGTVGMYVKVLLLTFGSDGSTRVLNEEDVLSRDVTKSELDIDQPWARTIEGDVERGQRIAVRLELELRAPNVFHVADVGSPGSGRGVGYTSMEACAFPLGARTDLTAQADAIERDLYDKRCLPGLWLPTALGGKLEQAVDLVETRVDAAAASSDPGANVAVARERLVRAEAAIATGNYQRACKSLSDGIRALTTP